jgi:glucose-6-phosphate isomerase
MSDDDTLVLPPTLRFEIDPADGTPALLGSVSRYDKRLGELDGIYADADAFARALAAQGEDALAYWVEESRAGDRPGALIIGMSALRPGLIGREFAMTRGHLHARPDCAEFYYGVAGRGVLLMDDLHGRTQAVELTPGVGVHVPGGWIHRSVNVGAEVFAPLFSYDADAGQDYGIIGDAGGMRELIVADAGTGWTRVANPRHRGYRTEGPR